MSRKLDLSQFRGDDDDDNALPPAKRLELNALKSRTFSHGITKKSKKDIERETEERKKKEEEEAAARALAEFEDAFDGPSSGPSMGYSRSRGGGGGGFVMPGGAPMAVKVALPPPTGPPRGPAAMGYARQPPRALFKEPSPPPAMPKPKGKRAMDHFLAEIKGNQAARESRLGKVAKLEGSSVSALAAWEHSGGARPLSEQESTNLHVANVPGSVTEETLGKFFADIGPVGTVKIMWPRSELEMDAVRRGKFSLQGFVAYMRRKDAETAVRELDGADWGGAKLKVSFSKPVPIPQRALYDLGTGSSKAQTRSRTPDNSRSRRASRSPNPDRRRGRSTYREAPRSPTKRRRGSSSGSTSSQSESSLTANSAAAEKWLSKIPEEHAKFVRAVASKVKDYGRGFEDTLRERERANPEFAFLIDDKLPEYHLYRSSLSSRYRIPVPPQEFDDDGYASMYSTDSGEESEKERMQKGKIGKLAKKRFESMLRVMSGKRAEIARAMEFAMNKAEAADDIAEVVCQSLRLDNTPVPRKIARLHLVSDILHNSASPLPNVWRYRLAFEKRLPQVFVHFKGVFDSLHAYSGNISAIVFKDQVGAVLEVWERWIVFTQDVQDSLRDYFLGTRRPGQDGEKVVAQKAKPIDEQRAKSKPDDDQPLLGFKSSGFKSSFKPIATAATPIAPAIEEDVDGDAMDDVDGEPIEDLDGEAMEDDVDGEVMGDVDGEEMEMEMETDDDVDGEAM